MRVHRFLAVLAAAVLAGCGGPSTEPPKAETVTSTITDESASRPSPSPSHSAEPGTSTAAPGATPGKTSGIGDVVAWIEAGQPAPAGAYQNVTGPDGLGTATTTTTTTTRILGGGAAFRSPSKGLSCFGLPPGSDVYAPGLTCLAKLANPPARPSDTSGQWIGGWVEYTGNAGHIGSVHGDPGPFLAGDGPILPYGQKISFGQDGQQTVCRMDQTGLWCADTAHGSAILLNDQGIAPYGCLKAVSRRGGEGLSYAC